MKLTPIQKNQFPQWKEMRQAIYGSLDDKYHELEMSQTLQSDIWFCYFLTDPQDQILGLVEMSARNIVDGCLSSPVAYLEGLYLKPPYRGQGLGRQTMELILQWCRTHGFSELATDTELENTAAQHFYAALGFEETDRVVEFRIDVDG